MQFIDVNKAAGDRILNHELNSQLCFGSQSMRVEYVDSSKQPYSHAIFDLKTQEVLYISVEVPGQPQAFQWIHTDYKLAYYKDCNDLGIDPQVAWDNINFTNVETEELILEYLKDIGEGYYDNLPIVDNIPTLTDEVEKDTSFTMPMPGTMGGAKFTFGDGFQNEQPTKTYTVNLDVRMVFDVEANNMDEAIAKARRWQEESKTSWGSDDDVSWRDHYIVKESIEHNTIQD